MITLSLSDILPYLLLAARWTLLLSFIAFVGGGIGATLLLLWRYGAPKVGGRATTVYIQLLQGTPLLLQLFLVFFGLPLLGIEVSPLFAASIALTLYASAFLAEIWRGCVDAVPRGQWDASASLGMSFTIRMRYVILPQALKIAIPPTVGFLVQLVKSTALASIVGFEELTRSGQIVANATFKPLIIYGLVALIYFAICYPLTLGSRVMERRLRVTR
ncbi:MAG: amino acid transporter permease [Cypionkella sp.]|uniref:amino acid ABC transporter permease n=1 Tax=Cypionkella sp. TaxID=2811411 RepID=UPI0026382700|nr:amino acid ABC transporter permease [Cypionkella sp.]MDB5660329.1 amino acid transporter permease [Cypionkella sp.]